MQVSIESADGLNRQLKIGVPKEMVNQEIQKKIKSLTKTTRINGFRPGKVPVQVIQQRYGDQVRREVIGEVLRQTFSEALEQEKLQPATEPHFDLIQNEADQDLEYSVRFEVLPHIEEVQLEGMRIEQTTADIQDADIDKMIENLRKQRATWEESSEAAAMEDIVTIDFEGSMNGETFEGGSAENQRIVLGAKRFIEGFEAGLEGHAAGDQVELDLQFPENYHNSEFSGKPVHFSVTLHKVEKPQLPEIDESFMRAFGVEPATMENLRAEVRENMRRQLDQALKDSTKKNVFKALVEKNEMPVPNAMVEAESASMAQNMMANFQRQGFDQSQLQLSPEMFRDRAEERIRQGILMGEIIRRNELKPDPSKVHQLAQSLASTYENPDAVVQHMYSDPKQMKELENAVLEEQVTEWILEQEAVTIEPNPSDFFSIMETQNKTR